MISLCNKRDTLLLALESATGCRYIREVIKLYLYSYGTQYDFVQFYVQTDDALRLTAVILRYNTFLYVSTNSNADKEELTDFIRSFSDSEVLCDKCLIEHLPSAQECFVFERMGTGCSVLSDNVTATDDARFATDLIGESMSGSKAEDLFLNTSHQIRHGTLKFYLYCENSQPASVVGVSVFSSDVSIIPFVYTGEYFRGNGYSKVLLASVCQREDKTYQLVCEEHNIKFYEKCGFSLIDTCLKILL